MLKEDWRMLAKRLDYGSELEMFQDLYERQKISIPHLARRLGFTQGTIARRLKLLGIEARSRGGSNRDHHQQLRLWRFDQRLVRFIEKRALAELLKVSTVTLQNFLDSCERRA